MKRLMVAVVAGAMAAAAWADVSFSYSGCLKDAQDGTPLTGPKTVIFRLYDSDADGAEALWSQQQTVNLDANGFFSTEIKGDGSQSPLEDVLRLDSSLYLGLTVFGASGEIKPRQRVLDVPRASFAHDVNKAKGDFTVSGVARIVGNLVVGNDNGTYFEAGTNGVSIPSLTVGLSDSTGETSGKAMVRCPLTLENTLTAAKGVTTEGALKGASLDVTANAEIGGTLSVSDTVEVKGTLTAKGGLALTGDLTASSNVTVSGTLSAGTVQANTFMVGNDKVNFATFTKGMIIMWHGTADQCPEGWAICDGSTKNGVQTPDLRGCFIVGASPNPNQAGQSSKAVASAYAWMSVGGEETHELATEELPKHAHSLSAGSTWWSVGVDDNTDFWFYVPKAWSGKHGVTGSSGQNPNMNTGAAGGGKTHENRPPYYALYYIMKL